jgi:hypothetical protein
MIGTLTVFGKERPMSRALPSNNLHRAVDVTTYSRPLSPTNLTPETVASLPPPGL